jgi:lycopene cyclase CruA
VAPHRSIDVLREYGGTALVERLLHLDRVRTLRTFDSPLRAPEKGTRLDADVAFLGGGLSLLIAAELARLGVRVVVLERARAGQAHREWNASLEELSPLWQGGLLSREELSEFVVAQYTHGVCTFHGSPPREVRGVLDHAVDASLLLARVRSVAEARGVRFYDAASVHGLGAGEDSVRVAWTHAGGRDELTARLAVDARGAASPYASADLVCPTVGGVMRGLHFDQHVGDILVTTEGAVNGRQHVWEGFPGRDGELTVYLFYYALSHAPSALSSSGTLVDLYARYFQTLASYKSGTPTMVRPTFGYIPGWSRLSRAPTGPSPRVVLVGDAAARHSPLTFCGFGSMLRRFRPVAASLAKALEEARAPKEPLAHEEDIHAWTGLLARLMATGTLKENAMNALLGDAFATLAEMGNARYADLLKDRMNGRDFIAFLRETSKRHPRVYEEVMRSLGPIHAGRWGLRLLKGALA